MTGVIINNNEYQVSTGSTKIEYSSMGGGTVGYSMYGDEVPYEELWNDITPTQFSQLGSATYDGTNKINDFRIMLRNEVKRNQYKSWDEILASTGCYIAGNTYTKVTFTYDTPIFIEYLELSGSYLEGNYHSSSDKMGYCINDNNWIEYSLYDHPWGPSNYPNQYNPQKIIIENTTVTKLGLELISGHRYGKVAMCIDLGNTPRVKVKR